MSEIWRHLAFDFRRHGWLAAGALIIAFFAPRLGQGLVAVVVVPLLVMNHKTAGSKAWWLDRPLKRNRLAIAKLLEFLMLFTGVLAILSAKWVAKGFDPVFVAWCKLEELLPLVAACGLTAVLASLSKDLRRYFLLIPVALILAAGAATAWAKISGLVLDLNAGPEILRFFPTEPPKKADDLLLISLFSGVGFFAAFWVQFRMRRMSWTIVLTGISILAPIYLVAVFFEGYRTPDWVIARGTTKPMKGHISVCDRELIAESQPSRIEGESRWLARIPLEVHLGEKLAKDEFLNVLYGFEMSPQDDPKMAKKRVFVRGVVNKQLAILHAAKRESKQSFDSGRLIEALFTIPLGTDASDWIDRPLEINNPFPLRMWLEKARYVGSLALEPGSEVNDGVNRFRLKPAQSYTGEWVFSTEELRPRSTLNPAWRFVSQWESHSFVLWDSRTNEAHFSDRGGVRGYFGSLPTFPTFSEWHRLAPDQLRELEILVIRHERIGTREIEIKSATFTIRLPKNSSNQ